MRELHVIGLSPDGRHVLLAGTEGATRPTHALLLDERLSRVLRGQSADGETAPALSPKEIQAAIRAGASVEELAASSGMATTRIARYAGPVLDERERELATLLSLTQVSRRGRSAQPLGEAAEAAVSALAFLRPETVTWTAFRREDGAWLARLSLVVRGRPKVAEWSRDPQGDLRPADSWAAGLGHLEAPVRRARAAKADAEAPAAPAAKAGKATKAPAKAVKATTGPVKKTVKAPAKKAPAKKTAATKAPARKATKAPAKKAPAAKATKAATRGRR